MVQSSPILTFGLRMVKAEGLFPAPILSGPSSISTFWFTGSTRADLGPEDNPNNMILSTVQSVRYLLPLVDATALDVSFPSENVKWR